MTWIVHFNMATKIGWRSRECTILIGPVCLSLQTRPCVNERDRCKPIPFSTGAVKFISCLNRRLTLSVIHQVSKDLENIIHFIISSEVDLSTDDVC